MDNGDGKADRVPAADQSADALVIQGMVLRGAKDYEASIGMFTEALARNPHLMNVYRYRAEAYRRVGMVNEAQADEDRAEALAKDSQSKQPAPSGRGFGSWVSGLTKRGRK